MFLNNLLHLALNDFVCLLGFLVCNSDLLLQTLFIVEKFAHTVFDQLFFEPFLLGQ